MASVSTYLNFPGNTEQAFEFYRSVFGTDFGSQGIMRMGDVPVESLGRKLRFGNNSFINLQTDTRAEADRLFAALAAGGEVDMPLQEMFWGDYFGSLTDRFGVQWMFNCASKT